MNQNTCYHCGGELTLRGGRWVCAYCGSYMPDNISREEFLLLTSACQKLRLADFFEAEQEFEDIIRRHPKNAQAYWGHLLAKYGIKYEEDYDGKRIPTCYAASIESVFDSSDYAKAIAYADEENRTVFKEHAEYIERVRCEWLEKAEKEAPYDIFISYKDSDRESGFVRTRDSYHMQELYIYLTGKGYRVFFSHESLRDKAGEKYEPYIYGALSTARVMLVYGSKPDYINATWVKNEWTRYFKRMKAGEKRQGSLLVAYEGFAPSELPTTLSSLQCLDASDRRFYPDLLESIEKILKEDNASEVHVHISENASVSREATCSHVPRIIPGRAPTCTQPGLTEGSYCTLCGEILKPIEIVPAVGHRFGDWRISKKATCTEDGEHERLCACGERETKRIPSRGGHVANFEWETVRAAEPGKDGLKARICMVCGEHVEEERIPALPFKKEKKTVSAAKKPSTGLRYEVNDDQKTCKITGSGTCEDADLLIPKTLCGYKVTGIGATAFWRCKRLVSVTIPDSVMQIGATAFFGCENLKNVYYAGTEAQWNRITLSDGWNAESGIREIQCRSSIPGSDETVTVQIQKASYGLAYEVNYGGYPSTCKITGIGSCRDIDLTIPETIDGHAVTMIAPDAFRFCDQLESVTFSEKMTSVCSGSFCGCNQLKSVIIPTSVTNLGDSVFKNCPLLTSVRYNGTKKEWKQITLHKNWRQGSLIKKAECADGTVKFIF